MKIKYFEIANMTLNLATKKHSFSDKWEQFQTDGIDRLIKFLSDDIKESNRVQDVKQTHVFNNKDFMRLYKIIYDLCIVPKGSFSKTLYAKYVDATSTYLTNRVLPDLSEVTGTILLKKLANHWDKHMNIFVKWLGKCFRYLDQHYVKQQSLETVAIKGESLFRSHVFFPIKLNVLDAIIDEFEKEREGECIDDFSLKQVIQMIIKFRSNTSDEVDFYKELEEMFTRETSRYYNMKGKEFLRDYTCEEYLLKVEMIIDQEKFRIEKYMKESSFDRYIAVVQDELLVKNMEQLLSKSTGLEHMLSNHTIKSMKLVYKLYSPLQE